MSQADEVLKDALARVVAESARDLATANAAAVHAALMEVEENKLTVGVSIKFQLIGQKLLHATKISFSTKFTDDCEGVENLDKDQLKLPMEESVRKLAKAVKDGSIKITVNEKEAK